MYSIDQDQVYPPPVSSTNCLMDRTIQAGITNNFFSFDRVIFTLTQRLIIYFHAFLKQDGFLLKLNCCVVKIISKYFSPSLCRPRANHNNFSSEPHLLDRAISKSYSFQYNFKCLILADKTF